MFPYIIKATICLVLLLGFYHFVLEKEKMHRFNRFYLIGAIIFSFIVPSFIITVAPAEFIAPILDNSEFVSQMLPIETSTIQAAQEIDYTNYFIGLYILISAILLLILTKKITQLLIQTRRNKKVSYFSATVVLLKEQIVPYSFLQYIFLNKFTYQTNTIEQQILTHELAHVQQKHSLDVLFIEVLQNLFWFNPIFRFYKKAIQLNHEFLADDAVIQSHKNITEYQYLLLNTTAQQNNIYLASNFNYSLTKKRLLMMTKPSSKTKILLKKLLVLPLIAGFIFAFAQRVEAQEKLPQVVEVKSQQNNELVILIKKDGKLIIKNHTVSYRGLNKVLNKEIKEINNAHVILKTDPKAPLKYAHLNRIKNALRKNGIYQISLKNFAVSPKEEIIITKEKGSSKKRKPQIIEVVDHYNNDTYKHLNESYEKLRNKKPHYVKSSKKRQQNLDFLFSKLGSTYFKLSKADKRKVKRPVHPHYPYIRLKKNGTIFYKLKSELTAEDKKLLPLPPPKPRIKEVKPVSIKVIEKANSNELIEVIEEKEEVVEQKELIEIEEVAEEKEKIEVIEDRASSNQWVEFVEILQSAPGKIDVNSIPPPPSLKVKATEEEINRYQKAYAFWKKNKQKPKSISKSKRIKTLLNYISKLDKRDAKFTYNKKNISYKKAQYLISKKNIHNIHANENNDKTIVVKLSAKPFVIETAK